MSVCRNGEWRAAKFNEIGAGIVSSPLQYSYTPQADTTNICLTGWAVNVTELLTDSKAQRLRIEVDIEYSGFDASSTAGTFRLYWQGSNYDPVAAEWVWSGNNYLTAALNAATSEITPLVNGKNGSYHYNVVANVPDSWLDSFTRSYIGVRCNFSNGTGKFTMKNLTVYPDREFGMTKAHLNNENSLVSQSYIEI